MARHHAQILIRSPPVTQKFPPSGQIKVKFGGRLWLQNVKHYAERSGNTLRSLMRGFVSGLTQFQALAWCGGEVMSTRRKHGALNGITRGDVNLGRAGGELNMIRGLQWEGRERGWRVRREGLGERETIPERRGRNGKSKDRNTVIIGLSFKAWVQLSRYYIIVALPVFISLKVQTAGVCW